MQGFELVNEQEIPELKSVAKVFRHEKTSALIVSVENDDENKVFGASFRTLPSDSTGIAHILEHVVLGGSRKYPVKEPFLELIKGSLQTFVNAMTYPDKTVYPVASTNQQDFYNLVDVYLDAVFFPTITRRSLAQEGWHFELEDAQQPLVYRGIVFNEMKGAYSSPDSRLGRISRASLFPDNVYQHDSGGDPEIIPDLTYEQFTEFYRTHYHPSNALLWFWGDDPTEQRLAKLAEYLDEFEPLQDAPDTMIPVQVPFQKPAYLKKPYAVSTDDAGEAKHFVTVNWALPDPTGPETVVAFTILNRILVGTPASPLRKALIESGLGEDLAGHGLDEELRQMMFSTGLRGVEAENVDKVEALIFDTLQALIENGIEPETIEAAVNTIEFRLRENNTGGYPRGLMWMLSAVNNWMYGGDPLAPMYFETALDAVKQNLADNEHYFEHMIDEWFLENTHRSTVILEPDPTLGKQLEDKELARLNEARQHLTEDDLQQIIEETTALKEWQNTPDTPEALDTIPRLLLEDLDKENTSVPTEVSTLEDVQVLYHDLFTNGIVYLDLGFDLHTLPEELLPFTNIFGRALLEMGTDTEDFVKLAQRIGRVTGGIDSTTFLSEVYNNNDNTAWLLLRGKATMDKADDLLAILKDILLTVKLDNKERFLQMVLEEKASEEASLVPGGHMVTYYRLRSHFDRAGWATEMTSGINYLFFLRKLAEQIQNDWAGVLDRLEAVRAALINRQAMLVNVTLDSEHYASFSADLGNFLSTLPSSAPRIHEWSPAALPENEGLTIPAQVNYVGKAANLYDAGFEMDASVMVISGHLRLSHLWEKIRMMGGAYGAFSMFEPNSGVFAFMSYRDPNLLNTINAYDTAVDYLANSDLSDKELTGAIIGAISAMDRFELPDAKGFSAMKRYLTHLTDEIRQKQRDEVLNTTAEDFRQFAEVLKTVRDEGDVVVLGSAEAIQKANEEKGGHWLTSTRVL